MRAMAGEGFAGANVTVPHKQAALAVADAASEVAREIGAANTLVFAEGGIHAHNTDADGFLAALRAGVVGGAPEGLLSTPEAPRGKRALVLGAGGAARAVVWALERQGARVEVWNRTAERAERLCAELGGAAVTGAADAGDGTPGEAPSPLPDQADYELIVNTSAAGLDGSDPFEHLPLAPDRFFAGQTVVDMVYGEAPSALLTAAGVAGATTVDGLEILVQQGALSLRIWTGREPPLEVMRAAARA